VDLTITDEEFRSFSRHIGIDIPDMEVKVLKGQSGFNFRTVHRIQKFVPEKQHVFGWASIGYLPDGSEYTDWQGDVLDRVEDIESAAYDFTLNGRDQGTEHIGKGGKGSLIESFVSCPEKWDAMGIPHGLLPIGWWTGFHVNDREAWHGVKTGVYKMFSVQGRGVREAIS
jgi:hypothetical protein